MYVQTTYISVAEKISADLSNQNSVHFNRLWVLISWEKQIIIFTPQQRGKL